MNIDNIPTGTTQISRQQIVNFEDLNEASIKELISSLDLKMSASEIRHCQDYYKKKPNSTINIDEIKTLDAVASDNKRKPSSLLLSTLTTSKEYIAKTYEDMMARRYAVNKDYQEPPSILELVRLLPEFLEKKKNFKNNLDDMAIYTGRGKYASSSNTFSKPIVEIGAGKSNALVVSGKKLQKKSSSLIIGDTLYAVLISFNPKKGFYKKISELVFCDEYSLSGRETVYINDESIMTYLSRLPYGIRLHTSPYERKTESYSFFADYARADEGIVFSARRDNVADLLLKAQEIGLTVIKLGTLTVEKSINAYENGIKIFSLSQDLLRSLSFKRLISSTLGNNSENINELTESSMYISTNQQKYKLCMTSIKSCNAFMSALNTIIYNYALALSSGADISDTLCGASFNISSESALNDGISTILGAYRASAELSLVPISPSLENGDGGFDFYTLSRVKNAIPNKLVGGGSFIYYLEPLYNSDGMPDFDDMRKMHSYIKGILKDGSVLSILPSTDNFEASFKKIKGRTGCELINASVRSHFGGFLVECSKEAEGILVARTEKKETVDA